MLFVQPKVMVSAKSYHQDQFENSFATVAFECSAFVEVDQVAGFGFLKLCSHFKSSSVWSQICQEIVNQPSFTLA